jgi:hypothetical protein
MSSSLMHPKSPQRDKVSGNGSQIRFCHRRIALNDLDTLKLRRPRSCLGRRRVARLELDQSRAHSPTRIVSSENREQIAALTGACADNANA